MLKRSRMERERPVRLVALVAAVWLVTIAVLAGYAEEAPAPISTAAAVFQVTHLN